jgi:hypothetical protein
MRTTPYACLLLTAAALTLGCDSNPTQPAYQPERPSAAVIDHEQDHNLSGPVENDCTGEVFIGTGKINTVNSVTDDGAGGVHETIHLNLQFAGTSETTGVRYVGNQVLNLEFNGKIGEENTILQMFTLIGQGNVPNEKSTFQFHVTVRPDLTVTSYIDDFHILCQGF